MAPRAGADDRRDALVDALADHLLDVGLAGASLRSFAAVAETSDRMLLYYFKDKAEIVAAAMARVAERMTVALTDFAGPARLPLAEATVRVVAFASSAEMRPGMQLWLEAASAAARGDALCRTVGEAVARGFVAWGQTLLDSPPEHLAADAARLMLAAEGAVFLSAVGLDDIVALAIHPRG
jgi:AcrR family transcriptional regulator